MAEDRAGVEGRARLMEKLEAIAGAVQEGDDIQEMARNILVGEKLIEEYLEGLKIKARGVSNE